MINKVKIRNVYTYAFSSRKELLNYISNRQTGLIAVNAEKIMQNDQKLHEIINNNLAYADGIGAVMALRQKGIYAIKIPGAEFWLDIVDRFYNEKNFYLIGSRQVVIEKTVYKLECEFPAINIIGYRNGFLKEGDKEKLITEIKYKKPDIVFVAQGSPRQEYLIDELFNIHPALYMGLGGSFDVYCGFKKRAPKILLNANAEFLYRLLKEPWRTKRQFKLIKFYVLLKLGRL